MSQLGSAVDINIGERCGPGSRKKFRNNDFYLEVEELSFFLKIGYTDIFSRTWFILEI